MRKYYKYDRIGYLAKDYRLEQKMKKIITNRRILSEVWSKHSTTNLCI